MARLRDLYDALPWRHRSRAGNGHGNGQTASLTDVLETQRRHDLAFTPTTDPTIVDIRTRVVRPNVTGKEYGATGTENFGGYIRKTDPNPDLDNFQVATKIYDRMRRADAQIRSMLQVLKLPLRGATWTALPPDGGDNVDQAIADFVNRAIFDDDAMEFSWDHTLRHVLLQLDYGFSVLETIWDVDDEGAYRIRRLAPRLPKTIVRWHVDRSGRLLAAVQWAPVPMSSKNPANSTALVPGGSSRVSMVQGDANQSLQAPFAYNTYVSYQYLTIPSDYLVVFTLEREGDNYEGSSILRTIYRNYFYKDEAYHLEGVRLDRWGVGIPVASLAPEHTLSQDDLDAMVEVLKKVRANERAYLIAPPHVTYDLLPKTGSATAGSGAMDWINHHDAQIARNVLAGFLTMGQDPHGTLGFGSRLTDMFVSSLNGVAAGICGDLKKQLVRKICDLNFDMTKRKYPRVTVRDLEQVDMDNLIKALTAFAGTGAQFIQPDDDTEKLLRKMLQIPDLQPEMSRDKKSEAPAGTAAEAVQQQQQEDAGLGADAPADPGLFSDPVQPTLFTEDR
jgi:hypothetical protein